MKEVLLTPESFAEMTKDKLLVRGLIEDEPFRRPPPKTVRTTRLSFFTTVMPDLGRAGVCSLEYRYREPAPQQNMHCRIEAWVCVWTTRQIKELLETWRQETPLWLAARTPIICYKSSGRKGRVLHRIDPTYRPLLFDYGRAHAVLNCRQVLCSEEGVSVEWIIDNLFHRVQGFVTEYTKKFWQTMEVVSPYA